ncbi:MAG: hypothetical protein R3Y36_01400, partial [Spirochaetales bacterium]
MRKVFILLFCVLLGNIFAQSTSQVSITEKLFVIKTDYFDLIFAEDSLSTAEHLAKSADDIYIRACNFLGVESSIRFPVVITTQTDVLNAFFTLFPYSRIVLYDAAPTESISVFKDTLVSIFYHEVIHAISLNIKPQLFTQLFGDMPSVFMLANPPLSVIEGTAVSAESEQGDGRLNNAYSMHVIRQAKAENKFPDWRDIAGAYSLYTEGSLPYMFGGAFTEYIYRIYGAQKLSDFWYELSKIQFAFYESAFKTVYEISLDEAWADFEKAIYVPTLEKETQSFFEKSDKSVLYQNLTASQSGIAWQNGFTGTIYFFSHENQKTTRLYTTDLTGRLQFSKTGQYLVSSGTTGGNEAKNTVTIFDTKLQKIIYSQKNMRDAAIVEIPENISANIDSNLQYVSSVLAGVQTTGSLTSLVLYDLENNSEPLVNIPFERNTVIFEPVDAGNGLIIALLYRFGTWEFFVYDYVNDVQRRYTAGEIGESPSGISGLYASENMLYMSYAQDVFSQSVLAGVPLNDFFTDTLTVYIQKNQMSGGVFSPVVLSQSNENTEMHDVTLAYISKYYDYSDISILQNIGIDDVLQTANFISYTPDIAEPVEPVYEIETYRASNYMDKGFFIPFLGSMNFSSFGTDIPYVFSIGASAFTIDPAQRFLIGGGAGMDVFTKDFTASLSSIFTEGRFTLATDVFTAFSPERPELFAVKLFADYTVPVISDFNYISMSNLFRWYYFAEESDNFPQGTTLY